MSSYSNSHTNHPWSQLLAEVVNSEACYHDEREYVAWIIRYVLRWDRLRITDDAHLKQLIALVGVDSHVFKVTMEEVLPFNER